MSNIFKEIEDDVNKVEEELLGPPYKYYEKISTLGEGTFGIVEEIRT